MFLLTKVFHVSMGVPRLDEVFRVLGDQGALVFKFLIKVTLNDERHLTIKSIISTNGHAQPGATVQ